MNSRERIRQIVKAGSPAKFPKVSGVYAIVNTKDSRAYIGSAKNIRERIGHHKYCLRAGVHSNKRLLAAWNEFGEGSFVFGVMDICSESERVELEHYLTSQILGAECYNWSGYGQRPDVKNTSEPERVAAQNERIKSAFNEWAANNLKGASEEILAASWIAWHDAAFYERTRIAKLANEPDSDVELDAYAYEWK